MSAYTQIEATDIPLHHLWRALHMTQAEFVLCLEYRRFTWAEQKIIKQTIKEWEAMQ